MANISLSLHTPSSPVNFLHFKHRMEWLQKRSILIELGSTGSGGQLTLTFSSGEVKEYCLTATFNVYNACFAAFGSLSCSINKIESHSLRRLRTHWAIVDRTLAEHSTLSTVLLLLLLLPFHNFTELFVTKSLGQNYTLFGIKHRSSVLSSKCPILHINFQNFWRWYPWPRRGQGLFITPIDPPPLLKYLPRCMLKCTDDACLRVFTCASVCVLYRSLWERRSTYWIWRMSWSYTAC